MSGNFTFVGRFTFTLGFTIFMFRGWSRFLGSFLHHGYEPARWVLRPWFS